MTNGEVIKAMFPTITERFTDTDEYTNKPMKVEVSVGMHILTTISTDVWNSEYKEPTTKNDKVDCEHTDCDNCVNHKYCDYEPTTKNNLAVDCILRQQAIDAFPDLLPNMGYNKKAITEILQELPSVTPQEPKIGHWFIDERPESNREVICSNCEQPIFKYHKLDFDYRPKYCPNCGANMREVEE